MAWRQRRSTSPVAWRRGASRPQQRESGNQHGSHQRPPMHLGTLTPEDVTLRLALDPLFSLIHVARTACGQRDSSLFARLEDAESGEPQRQKYPKPSPPRSVIADHHKPQDSCRDSRHKTQGLAFTNFSSANVCDLHDKHLTVRNGRPPSDRGRSSFHAHRPSASHSERTPSITQCSAEVVGGRVWRRHGSRTQAA